MNSALQSCRSVPGRPLCVIILAMKLSGWNGSLATAHTEAEDRQVMSWVWWMRG